MLESRPAFLLLRRDYRRIDLNSHDCEGKHAGGRDEETSPETRPGYKITGFSGPKDSLDPSPPIHKFCSIPIH